jgi:hypothetical protein
LDLRATKKFLYLYSSSSSSWDAWGTRGVVVVVERFGAPQEEWRTCGEPATSALTDDDDDDDDRAWDGG